MSVSRGAAIVGAVLMAIAVLNSAATQWLAWRFAYHPSLGEPWIGHLYAPWAWIDWYSKWHTSSPVFQSFHTVVGAVGMLGALAALAALSMQGRRAQRHDGIHGTAHFADAKEVRKASLLPKRGKKGAGVYVGGWEDPRGRLHYLRHNGPEHIAAIAPTRSGKGVGLVVPTLLSWPHSLVVNDMKGELWNLTAAWRRQAVGPVLRFDPSADEGSVAFNPLEEIRLGTTYEVGDVMNLVTILVDPHGKGLVDHWAKTAHAFLTGVVLHVLYKTKATGKQGSLPDIATALSDPHRPIEGLYREMVHNKWGKDGSMHETIAQAARDMQNRPPEERGSVLSTAMSFLSLYRDPLIAKNVARSDFRIMDLMNLDKPVTLYLIVRAEDKDRMKPLIRLMINQLVRVLLRPSLAKDGRAAAIPHKHRLLLMLDEFPSYGKLEVFEEALAVIAGYGIKAYLIMQDVSQLWGAYGKDESILSNCHIRVAYAPNKVETAKWLSENLGTTTIVKEDITTSGDRHSAVLRNISKTYHQIARALMTADEVMRLKSPVKDDEGAITEPGEMLVFVSGHAPIKGTQSLYFRDPVFAERAELPPPADCGGLRVNDDKAAFRFKEKTAA